ncbi:sulfatase-like hydrolase/transferase [Parabacteroides faecis]|uniref:sulfatase-like hydrolase/transferase n=1 Tax=Parabacteroides faecis TaxID=1217282 RepID=UPI002164E9AF|nr:sulfatase-like hydrolase/transferase [Parabacteroides faecis]MCS2891216.1 sulfatase-like hydrolase/transferase [Parabacteroides faecis]UVQ45132.1 sulfatase-like hydrolase/transferase [Parabacteroides faecis]
MDKLIRNRGLLLSLGSMAVLSGCAQQPQEQKKPNIVFIFADDMGYGDVSALNENSKIQTTNIDRIASEGVTFTDAHSSSSVSTPSRYSLLTGRYNWRSDLKSGVLMGYNKALISPDRRTIASVLRDQGYQTACIGKWHLGWDWNNIEAGKDSVDFSKPITNGPTTRGFDYFYGIIASLDMAPYVYVENDMPTALPDRETVNDGMKYWRKGPTASDFDHEQTLPNFINRAVDYIHDKSKEDKPFYLYLPLPAPHTPILPIKEYQGKSGLNPYGDFVLMVDDMVGKVMKALKAAGVEENTIIVFSTDNGCSPQAKFDELQAKGHYPSYIYRGHKADLFDGGHRIPCVVRWPARVKPHVVDQTVCLTDFFATFAAVADYQLRDSEGEDSYNILPLLLNEKEGEVIREATVHHSINGDFTIRKGEWKLLLSPGSGGWSFPKPGTDDEVIKTLPSVQLYNMQSDPAEKNNVYAEHPEVVKELKGLMIKYVKEGRSTPGTPQKNDGPEVWKQLSWME